MTHGGDYETNDSEGAVEEMVGTGRAAAPQRQKEQAQGTVQAATRAGKLCKGARGAGALSSPDILPCSFNKDTTINASPTAQLLLPHGYGRSAP